MRLAVVGDLPLVRRGVVLQLRASGVTVDAEVDAPAAIPAASDVAVVVAPDVRAAPAVCAVGASGAAVLVLTGAPGRWRTAVAATRPSPAPGEHPRVDVLPLTTTVTQVVAWLAALDARVAAGPALTATERDVYDLLARGLSNAGIARLLSLSPRTVECHVSHVFGKLGLTRDPSLNPRVAAALHWPALAVRT